MTILNNNALQKKKVFFFLPNSMGGSQRMTITIAKNLDRNIYQVEFVVVRNRKEVVITKYIPKCFNVLYIEIDDSHKSLILLLKIQLYSKNQRHKLQVYN